MDECPWGTHNFGTGAQCLLCGAAKLIEDVEHQPIQQGILLKRGDLNSHWDYLYFELRGTALTYFKPQNKRKAIGSISVIDCVIRRSHDDMEDNCFDIIHPSKIWRLSAPSHTHMVDWLNRIQDVTCVAIEDNLIATAEKQMAHDAERQYELDDVWSMHTPPPFAAFLRELEGAPTPSEYRLRLGLPDAEFDGNVAGALQTGGYGDFEHLEASPRFMFAEHTVRSDSDAGLSFTDDLLAATTTTTTTATAAAPIAAAVSVSTHVAVDYREDVSFASETPEQPFVMDLSRDDMHGSPDRDGIPLRSRSIAVSVSPPEKWPLPLSPIAEHARESDHCTDNCSPASLYHFLRTLPNDDTPSPQQRRRVRAGTSITLPANRGRSRRSATSCEPSRVGTSESEEGSEENDCADVGGEPVLVVKPPAERLDKLNVFLGW